MRAIAFVGDQQSFNKPVEVALDADHRVRVLGFITREELQSLGLAAFAQRRRSLRVPLGCLIFCSGLPGSA